MRPLVSVICLTYNHKNFIRRTINRVLNQKTSFNFEIIIHDDASTDGTTEILTSYKKIFKDKIKLIIQCRNQYNIDGVYPIKYIYPQCQGKYIALCEGDDWWSDEYKLQKQVNFLENNPEWIGCFHDCNKYDMRLRKVTPHLNNGILLKDLNSAELINYDRSGVLISACTTMWRNFYNEDTRQDYEDFWGDHAFIIMMGMYGGCKYLTNIKPSVYRIHDTNSWIHLTKEEKIKRIKEMHLRVYNLMLKKGNPEYINIRKSFL